MPDAVCRLIVATAGGLFVAADAFKGRREGMVFKLGGRGLGYYPDYNALEQAARYRELTVGERLDAIETQLHTDTSWSGDAQGVRYAPVNGPRMGRGRIPAEGARQHGY